MASLSELNPMRIVLLGKTGSGKSSAGNTIFGGGMEEFKIDSSANSETHKCEAKTKDINGRKLTVVDTPGLFDTDNPEVDLKPEQVKCIIECAPGPHAFLIVLKVEKYTTQKEQVITKIEEIFSPEVFKYATVLFTHGYQLKGETIENFCKINKKLSKLVEKCGGRCHVIDNEFWNDSQQDEYRNNQYQVAELLNTIEKMVRENGGGCYTNEFLQAVEREIEAETESLRKESKGQMSEEEMRKQAKERARKKLLIKLAGIVTGAVVGAFLGVAGSLAIVLSLLGPSLKTLIRTTAGGVALAGGVAGGVASAGGVAGGVASAGGVAGGVASAGGVSGATIGVGIAVGVTAVLAGAIGGGIVGAAAAEEAETPGEAAKKAAEAVWKKGEAVWKKVECVVDTAR